MPLGWALLAFDRPKKNPSLANQEGFSFCGYPDSLVDSGH